MCFEVKVDTSNFKGEGVYLKTPVAVSQCVLRINLHKA
jgi:hypothetical protein